jgi:hypothetical protein
MGLLHLFSKEFGDSSAVNMPPGQISLLVGLVMLSIPKPDSR